MSDPIISPYLDNPTRSLDKLREALLTSIAYYQRMSEETKGPYTEWHTRRLAEKRQALAVVEAELHRRSTRT